MTDAYQLLNNLPTVIDAPGDYVTRSGRRVTIHEVKQPKSSDCTEFLAKGSIWKKTDRMGINPEYQIWHISGRCFPLRESKIDIVGKWEKRNA